MRVAVIGLGNMGRALCERLLDAGQTVSVWNRTAGRAATLLERGAAALGSPRRPEAQTDAVFLCLADDRSVLDVAAPGGVPRASWSHAVVANTSTVSPETLTA